MEQYPSTLPAPRVTNYKVQPQEGILRTENEGGPARQRRRYTRTPTNISVQFLFTESEMGVFESWYYHRAFEGAAWFEIDLRSGLGIDTHVARFKGQFEAPLKSRKLWIVNAELEIRQRPVLTTGELDIVLSEDVDALLGSIDGLHTYVHTTLPSHLGN